MTTNIKYIKQYKEDIWGYYSFRKKRDKLTTLLDLLKVYKLAPAKAHYYKLKFHKKRNRKKRKYKKHPGLIRSLSRSSFAFKLTNVSPRIFFVDDYKSDLKKNNSYESLLLFLGLCGRSKYAIINITNNMYLRLQNLYTMIFLLTKNTQQQKREFFLKFILNIRSFYPNFREYLNKNKLTLKHIRKGLIRQNNLFKRIEFSNYRLLKSRKRNEEVYDLVTKDLDNDLFFRYNKYRQTKFNKKNVMVPSQKYFRNFEHQSLYQLKKLLRNIKQSLIKYPFFNFYRNLDYQEMYTKLIQKVGHELNNFIKKSKKYFNITVKSNILFFLNPKIKLIKTDLQIINKLIRNTDYLTINKPLLKLKYYLTTEKALYLDKLFIKTTRRHKKFILLHLLYKKEPFDMINKNVKSNKDKLFNIKRVYKKSKIIAKSYRFYIKSTRSNKYNLKNKVKLEIAAKKKMYKNKTLLNHFMSNEFYD